MLITDKNKELYKEKHKSQLDYGSTGSRYFGYVKEQLEGIESILDYGCGKGNLGLELKNKGIKTKLIEYDPCIEGKEHKEPCDLVVCFDVWEHIEPECEQDVLEDIYNLCNKKILFVISLIKAINVLPNGDNCHCNLKPADEWIKFIEKKFRLTTKRKISTSELLIIGVKK